MNPVGFQCTTPPILGTSWQSRITTNPGTVLTMVALGLGGPTRLPFLGGEQLVLPPLYLLSGLGSHSLQIPSSASAAGFQLATQGIRVDDIGGTLTPVLLNAQDLVLSFPRVNVTVHDPARAHAGLTTEITDSEPTSPVSNPAFRLFDMEGQVLRTWKDPRPNWAFAELVKPLSFGRVLALILDRATASVGAPVKQLVEIDWNGNVVWTFDANPLGFQLHHDFERLDNGNTLVIAQKPRLVPSINAAPILDDNIWEVDPQGNIVWDWSAGSHINQMGFTPAERQYLANFPGSAPFAVFHMNSVSTLPANQWEATDPRFKAGNILVSLRETNLVFIIDKATRNIVWRYQGAIGQHHPRMIPQNLPGAGNILLFDNGGRSGAPPITRGFSRVLELDPVTGAIPWSYRCTAEGAAVGQCPTFFFTKVMGGAQRLPNGNTLVTQSVGGRVFEVTPSKQIVWEYYAGTRVYRAYRWDDSWRNRGPMPKFVW